MVNQFFLLTSHLKRTIDICLNTLLENMEKVGSSKTEFKKLLSLAAKEIYSIFKRMLCKQVDGVAMGSPVGLMLANAFLVHFEKNWLQNCPSELKPYYYRQHVNDIFLYLPHKNI